MVTISTCKTARDLKKFEKIPEQIYRNHPWFTPPFPGSVVKLISPKSPFAKKGTIQPFIAYRDGKPVGRIAAIDNRAYRQFRGEPTGFFGFFDAIDDPEVTSHLFQAVEQYLQPLGIQNLRGPFSPSIHDECGLLVEGFEHRPFVMMPQNPQYTSSLLEQYGFEGAQDLYAFYYDAKTQPPERIEKICKRAKERLGITIRTIQMDRLADELKIIHTLYNRTLDRNTDFYPLDLEDVEFSASDLKAIVNPDLVLFAEAQGKPVGYSLTIPNINEFLWRARKLPSLLRAVTVAANMLLRHPREARLAALGVLPEYRNKGIAPLFYFETLLRGRRRYQGGELSWCEANNAEIVNAIATMGGQKYKTYRIYQKALPHQ